MPPTLSARARPLATGGDRKTDPADVLHVAQVALLFDTLSSSSKAKAWSSYGTQPLL
ncbi:hypothetical protein FBY35_0196 [Streptomyces sp. SLBN-118]|nr:hypothetical protein FBY35_0196 [Streptomyces sp. SLBN-118]